MPNTPVRYPKMLAGKVDNETWDAIVEETVKTGETKGEFLRRILWRWLDGINKV